MRVLHLERPIRPASGAASAPQRAAVPQPVTAPQPPIIGGLGGGPEGGRPESSNQEEVGSPAQTPEPRS
jgi:hypothetical protein